MNQVLSWLLVCGLSYIMFLVRSCPLTISGFPNKMFLRNMMVKVAVQYFPLIYIYIYIILNTIMWTRYYPNCGSERIAKVLSFIIFTRELLVYKYISCIQIDIFYYISIFLAYLKLPRELVRISLGRLY